VSVFAKDIIPQKSNLCKLILLLLPHQLNLAVVIIPSNQNALLQKVTSYVNIKKIAAGLFKNGKRYVDTILRGDAKAERAVTI